MEKNSEADLAVICYVGLWVLLRRVFGPLLSTFLHSKPRDYSAVVKKFSLDNLKSARGSITRYEIF